MQRVSVLPDIQDIIAKEVAALSPSVTHLITAGGIGPTHDDVTFEAVASAFAETLQAHPELTRLIEEFFGTVDSTSAAMKLALVPSSAKLNYGRDPQTGEPLRFPLVSVRNVYMFPGIPTLLERAFNGLSHLFASPGTAFHTREVFVDTDETEITPALTRLQSEWGKRVALGSYPDWLSNYYRVRLVLDSDSADRVERAQARLLEELPEGSVVRLVSDPVAVAPHEVYSLALNGNYWRNQERHVKVLKVIPSSKSKKVLACKTVKWCIVKVNTEYFPWLKRAYIKKKNKGEDRQQQGEFSKTGITG